MPSFTDYDRAALARIQTKLRPMFERFQDDRLAPRTIVVVPGLSLDADTLAKIDGVRHYEERQLSMLMWLRLPNTRIVFVTSVPLDPVVVDYYLSLLQGVPTAHARSRLTLLSAYDSSPVTLTRKILERPRLLARIRAAIRDPAFAHMSVFNASELEAALAIQLGIPLFACDPDLAHLGNKSGSRRAFKAAGVDLADGVEDLRDMDDAAAAIASLKRGNPSLRRCVIKHNDGFSGEGNAVFDFDEATSSITTEWVRKELPRRLRCEAANESFEHYSEKFREMGGIVEAWVEGEDKCSPSVQMRVDPLNRLELISTHDQTLGGESGQIFLGSTFPAREAYRRDLHEAGWRIGEVLRERGVLGRFAIDFVSHRTAAGWQHVAIEINLRKGGTTLPFHMLQFLTSGKYDSESARYVTPMGQNRCYYATDTLVRPHYRCFTPEDLIDIVVARRLHFDDTRQRGIVFNLLGALSEFGKLGVVCIAETVAEAKAMFDEATDILDREANAHGTIAD
ncbi:peptide ligase PGM1-related protein [Dokdonella sp.]|uniref:peptide ligase PGM1-related protein n=1 Tax=Dokdonella sp. TaxID=2291710 RepID=UPI0035295EA5